MKKNLGKKNWMFPMPVLMIGTYSEDGTPDMMNAAMPLFKGIDGCTYEEFAYAQAVGVTAPFYLAKLFKDHFSKGASIINISSSRDRMSQPQTESYTAAKGGIAALTHALAASLAGRVRVNSISPGWIDTSFRKYDGPDASQHFAGRLEIDGREFHQRDDAAFTASSANAVLSRGCTSFISPSPAANVSTKIAPVSSQTSR